VTPEIPLALHGRLIKDRARQTVARGLRSVPWPVLLALRSGYLRSTPASAAERTYGRILEVARHRGLPAGDTSFVLPDQADLRFVAADSLILHRLYWFGRRGWEPEVVGWWRHFCSQAREVLELGANVGYHTAQGASVLPAGGRLIAVEPHPVSVAILRENLRLNGLEERVDVVAAAASDRPLAATVDLLVPAVDHWGAPAGAYLRGGEIAPSSVRAIAVPAVPVGELYGRPDLVKLDVEGLEGRLLGAVSDHLRQDRPTLFVELLDGTPGLRRVLRELVDDAGYACFVPRPDGQLVALAPDDLTAASVARRSGTRDVILTCASDLPDRPRWGGERPSGTRPA